MDLANVANNQKRSKRKAFNEYGVVTDLVRKFKITNSEDDLLAVLSALEGIINTYTLMITPGDINQQIFITPYMKKFLGMFLTPDERTNTTNKTYTQAIARVRWIMRQYTYEDMYAKILEILIQAVRAMKIVGTCDCIYYLQLIVRYKLHDLIIKSTKDICVNLADIPTDLNEEEESVEDVLDRISYNPERANYENELISNCFYNDISVGVLTRSDDIFKCFSHYEKFLIYLKGGLDLKIRQIYAILKFESSDELKERLDDIEYKLELLAKEGE